MSDTERMAESQVPYAYDPQSIDALKASLSPQRFATYLAKAGGDEHYAFALYLYNARLAKSLLFPLSVTEVTLRNAVDAALVASHGTSWHQDAGLRNQVLTAQSLDTLDRAIIRAKSNARGKVIAELTFDFWSNLFRVDYAGFWRTKANIAFPGLPHGHGRSEVQTLVKEINRLRNRVAHHEHILDMNIPDLLAKMHRLTELRCAVTAAWMRHHTTVSLVMRARPSRAASAPVTFASRSDVNFVAVAPDDSLLFLCDAGAKSCCAFVCLDGGAVIGAFTHRQAMEYLADQASELEGLLDFKGHCVSEVLKNPAVQQGMKITDAGAAFAVAVDLLRQPQTKMVVGIDAATGTPQGVIIRAHRRY